MTDKEKKRDCDDAVRQAVDIQEECDRLIEGMQHAQRALMDLMLFLDTHPMDFGVRHQYMMWRQHYLTLKQEYQRLCGPLGWYGPNWWHRAMGFDYDPLDECFEHDAQAYLYRKAD